MLYKKLNTPHQHGEPEPSHRGHAGLHGHDRGAFEELRVVIEGTGDISNNPEGLIGFRWICGEAIAEKGMIGVCLVSLIRRLRLRVEREQLFGFSSVGGKGYNMGS